VNFFIGCPKNKVSAPVSKGVSLVGFFKGVIISTESIKFKIGSKLLPYRSALGGSTVGWELAPDYFWIQFS
jgi:hypothetical protein